MTRILMLLENESYPDDTRVRQEAEALVAAGHTVTVISPKGKNTKWVECVCGVRVYRYPNPWELHSFVGYVAEFAYGMLMALMLSGYVLARHGFDVIHVHTPPDMNALVAVFFRLFGKRIVVDQHDLSPELYVAQRPKGASGAVVSALRWFERVAVRSADRVIATNESQRRVQIGRCGAQPHRCYVVRNGPSEQFLGDVEPIAELHADPRFKIGYVGMIGVQDGVDCLISALAKIKQQRSDFLGVIVGDGPAVESLSQMVRDHHLEDNVQFTGMVPFDDVARYIASFDICTTPDPRNAYNDSCTTIKTMEYMAVRRPTVAFETTENRITAGDAAVYARDNDLDEFARLIELLMDDGDLRSAMGELGRERVEQSLLWERQQEVLLTVYADLIANVATAREPKTHAGLHQMRHLGASHGSVSSGTTRASAQAAQPTTTNGTAIDSRPVPASENR